MWGTMGGLAYLCTIAHFGGKTDVHDSNSPRAPDSCEYEWAQWETKSHDYKRTDGLRTYAQSLTYAAKSLEAATDGREAASESDKETGLTSRNHFA